MRQTGRKDLLAIGCSFADLKVNKRKTDRQWLGEIIKRMEDILAESEFLQEWVQKGKAEGLEEGSLRELRNMLIHVTTLRFPDLVDQMQETAKQSESKENLRGMIDKLITARTVQEARAAITI